MLYIELAVLCATRINYIGCGHTGTNCLHKVRNDEADSFESRGKATVNIVKRTLGKRHWHSLCMETNGFKFGGLKANYQM